MGEKEEQASKPKTVVRKSARLRGRQGPEEGETRSKTSKGQQSSGDEQKSGSDSKDSIPSVPDKKEEGMVAKKGKGLHIQPSGVDACSI